MSRPSDDPLPPRILVLDDERQIHASIRLRLGRDYELVFCTDAREALEKLQHERFDLCFADIHMPKMDGLTFIEHAREVDPALGFVILSAFDSGDNLRRAIPLQVYEFIGKPLPEREGFERRIPGWVDRTRRQRHDQQLAARSGTVAHELASAQLAHEVELVASESARDALLQSANLLTTIHAHLIAAIAGLAQRMKQDPSVSQLYRNLEAARNTAEAAVSVTDSFFNSAYASRQDSPAFVDSGIRQAIEIAKRLNRADEANQSVDFTGSPEHAVVRGLSGIDFLLTLVPLVGAALACAANASTVRITTTLLARLDVALKDSGSKGFVWMNRRNSVVSQPGIQILVTTAAPTLERAELDDWLGGKPMRLSTVAPRGLVTGLQKSGGLLGVATPSSGREFAMLLALPT